VFTKPRSRAAPGGGVSAPFTNATLSQPARQAARSAALREITLLAVGGACGSPILTSSTSHRRRLSSTSRQPCRAHGLARAFWPHKEDSPHAAPGMLANGYRRRGTRCPAGQARATSAGAAVTASHHQLATGRRFGAPKGILPGPPAGPPALPPLLYRSKRISAFAVPLHSRESPDRTAREFSTRCDRAKHEQAPLAANVRCFTNRREPTVRAAEAVPRLSQSAPFMTRAASGRQAAERETGVSCWMGAHGCPTDRVPFPCPAALPCLDPPASLAIDAVGHATACSPRSMHRFRMPGAGALEPPAPHAFGAAPAWRCCGHQPGVDPRPIAARCPGATRRAGSRSSGATAPSCSWGGRERRCLLPTRGRHATGCSPRSGR